MEFFQPPSEKVVKKCILLLASPDVHFDKRMNDMLLKWSTVKSTSEPKPQRKAYHLKDTSLLCDF